MHCSDMMRLTSSKVDRLNLFRSGGREPCHPLFYGHGAIHRKVDGNGGEEGRDILRLDFISEADVEKLLNILILMGVTNENHDVVEHSDHELLKDDLGPSYPLIGLFVF